MGNAGSIPVPERIYKAVDKNDPFELERVLRRLEEHDRSFDRSLLSYCDKEGRTPLIIAAGRNYYQCVLLLLRYGADVHYVATANASISGSALHAATRARHEPLVDLLLQYHASPFVCNAAGRTAVDEAVIAVSMPILRKFEQFALYRGTVLIKSNKLAGMSTPYKSRYVVVMPHLPCPTSPVQEIRRQMWIFKDNAALQPKCRVWLDGATAVPTSATDAVLRLHASHKPVQGDVHTRFDRGYCIYLRVAEDRQADYNALLDVVRLPPPPAAGGGAVAVPAAALPPAASYLPSMPALTTPALASSGLQATDAAVLRLMGRPASTPPTTPPVLHSSPAAAPTASNNSPAAAALPAATADPRRTVSSIQSRPLPTGGNADALQALPNETDEEFAARLASAYSAASASSAASSHAGAAAAAPPAHTALGGGSGPIPAYPSIPGGASGATAARLSASGTPAHARTPATSSSGAAVVGSRLAEMPSAPPLPGAAAAAVGGFGGEPNEAELCVICMDKPRECGVLHGQDVHVCVCRDCMQHIQPGSPCPMCRRIVERVIRMYH